MKSTLSILVAASALAMLTACGGGGGGGDSSPAAKDVAITSTNQAAVARASLNGGAAIALAQGSLSDGGTSGARSASALVRRAVAATRSQREVIASAGVHPAAVSSDTEPCQVSGSIAVSVDDRDGNGALSNGDVLTATFSQCRDSATSSINGTLTIALTATPTSTALDASASFQSVAVVDGDVSSTISGGFALHEVDGSTLSELRLTVGSAGLNIGVASSTYNDTVAFDAGMILDTSEANDGSQVSVTLNGSFTATSIGGRVTVSTLAPLTSAAGADYPGAGMLKIVGASGSTVLLTVLDSTQVQLQLDANGDGTYESSTVVAWTTLSP